MMLYSERFVKCMVLTMLVGIVLLAGQLASTLSSQHAAELNDSKEGAYFADTNSKERHGKMMKSIYVTGKKMKKEHKDLSFVSSNKPRLILHVGPSKTATTSLQTDLTLVQDQLQTDGYMYAGRYYRPYTNQRTGVYHLNRTESTLLAAAHSMLKRCKIKPRVKCCLDFAAEMKAYSHQESSKHQKQQYNIILSEEPFGNQWQNMEDWVAIRDSIGNDFDVTVVVGYRRFYAWLPSAHFQRERSDRTGPRKAYWLSDGGQAVEPLFPNWWNNWNSLFRYTTDILDAINGTFPVRIINLHNQEYRSPLTTLLCEILKGETETACERSLKQDYVHTVMNSRITSPSLYYDGIATAAAEQGLVNLQSWNRSYVRTMVRYYQEEELQLTPQDLALDCPSRDQLSALLNMSLDFEAKYMPAFLRHHKARDDHHTGFEKYVAQKVYCWVDTAAVLGQREWKQFFQQFSK